jgi:hypothetical protein
MKQTINENKSIKQSVDETVIRLYGKLTKQQGDKTVSAMDR